MTAVLRRAFVFASLALLAACGGNNGGNPMCMPGETNACLCSAHQSGTQTCQSDGTYGVCQCGGDAGVDATDADASLADASDGSTATDATDVVVGSDVVDVADAVSPMDVVDASDVVTSVDVVDVVTPADVVDVVDAADVIDAADVSNATDVIDVIDVATATDVVDVTDVATAVDVVDVVDVVSVADVVDVPPPPVCGPGSDGMPCASGHCCGGACVGNASVLTCGNACSPCPAPGNGTATCDGTACGIACDPGFHACGGACSADNDPGACGASCAVCPVPSGGTAVCTAGACSVSCNQGFVPTGGGCSPDAPRPVFPLSGSVIDTRTPTLRWALPLGVDGAHVDVCADRACASVIWSGDFAGTSGTTGRLPVKTSYWRLFGRVGGTTGTVPSATWQLRVQGTASAPRTIALGTVTDFNGDGAAEVVVHTSGPSLLFAGGSRATPSGPTLQLPNNLYQPAQGDFDGDGFVDQVIVNFEVRYGRPGGLNAAPDVQATITSPDRLQYDSVGDVNGDGYADLVIVGVTSGANFSFIPGSATGLRFDAATPLSNAGMECSNGGNCRVNAAGDVNGDGFSDVLFSNAFADTTPGHMYPNGRFELFLGSASGPVAVPSTVVPAPRSDGAFAIIVTTVGDVNGDGYSDILASSAGANQFLDLFLGGPAGITTTPSVTVTVTDGTTGIGSNSIMWDDFNADGLSDALVTAGSRAYALVYPGDATSGLRAPTQIPVPSVAGNCACSRVGTPGDIDGDGFGDMFVRDSNRLTAAMNVGTSMGLSTTPSWSLSNLDTGNWVEGMGWNR